MFLCLFSLYIYGGLCLSMVYGARACAFVTVYGVCVFPLCMVACFFHCVGGGGGSSRYGSLLFSIVYGVCVFPLCMAVCCFLLCIAVGFVPQTNCRPIHSTKEETGKTNSYITAKDNQGKLTYLGYTMHHFDPYTSGDFLYHPVKLK